MKRIYATVVVFTCSMFLNEPVFAESTAEPLLNSFSLDMGGSLSSKANVPNSNSFTYGGKLGIYVGNLADYKMVLRLSYDRNSNTSNGRDPFNDASLQYLFKNLNYGLYFGPSAGLIIGTTSAESSNLNFSPTSTNLALGLIAGYDFNFTKNISFGPEISYQHSFGDGIFDNLFTYTAVGTYHF